MKMTHRSWTIIGVAIAAVALLVGAGAAIAGAGSSSDSPLKRAADSLRHRDDVETAVAKALGTTPAKLQAAITAAAKSRVAAAEKAGTITASDADLLQEAIASGDHMATHLALAADVAKALGVTQAKLDAAYAAAHKAEALARVDAAEKAGQITATVDDHMRARIEATTFPGFGDMDGMRGGHGMHGDRDGDHGGMGPQGGMGPMMDGDHDGWGGGMQGGSTQGGSGSSTTQPTAGALT